MSWVWTIIGALFAGLIIGPLARLVLPGKQDISLIGTILSGAVGALAGGAIAQLLGVGDTGGIDWIKLFLQIAAGALAVTGYIAITNKK
ncbi:MAG TPA: GlsB/YeaQ/YmgE family stress response membrane protein [Candidatus Nanopelagicales bacterium]